MLTGKTSVRKNIFGKLVIVVEHYDFIDNCRFWRDATLRDLNELGTITVSSSTTPPPKPTFLPPGPNKSQPKD